MSDQGTEREPIEPVFTSEEWAAAEVEGEAMVDGHTVYTEIDCLTILNPDPADVEIRTPELPKLIALANAALPDSDLRKITRERVTELRAWVAPLNNHAGFRQLAVLLHHHADALASYLPTEVP